MKSDSELKKRLAKVDMGTSKYHYTVADYLKEEAEKETDPEIRRGMLERSTFHRLIGDGFSGKGN